MHHIMSNVVSTTLYSMDGEINQTNKPPLNLAIDLAKAIEIPILKEPVPDAQQHAVFDEEATIRALDELMVKLDHALEISVFDEEAAKLALEVMITRRDESLSSSLGNGKQTVKNSPVILEIEMIVDFKEDAKKNKVLDTARAALIQEAGEKKAEAYKDLKDTLLATLLTSLATFFTAGASLPVFIISVVVLVETMANALLARENFSRAEKGEASISGAEFLKQLLTSGMSKIGFSETVVGKVQNVNEPFEFITNMVGKGFEAAEGENKENAKNINTGRVLKAIAQRVLPGLVAAK